ncbi:hypothetical protein C5Z25_05880 [Lactobacillus sp. CBA3605]|uniref:VanZ family protein n=1 Tax=Lactobacillus sp. CBA3605 TaxID=2099788 RepID=UPI000CFD0CE9|nr:VanZ family protein [Lactobacillus sp. CBA3605]AVK61325.1 hypothetical protein C5Z25_05880 [Lactobacillus sp. CBA3605]
MQPTWYPFLLLTGLILIITIHVGRQAPNWLIRLKRLSLLAFLWILTAFCYTPTAYDFGSNVVLHYIQWGPVKLILNPFRHLDIEFWLNVVLTMPLGFLLGWNFPHYSWRRIIVLGLITGLSLETGQFILDWLVHLNRWVEVDDVLTNWAGVIIGFGSFQLLSRLPGGRWLKN